MPLWKPLPRRVTMLPPVAVEPQAELCGVGVADVDAAVNTHGQRGSGWRPIEKRLVGRRVRLMNPNTGHSHAIGNSFQFHRRCVENRERLDPRISEN